MPNRLACLAILIGWACASFFLFTRDVLPQLLIGDPPDFRDINRAADEAPGPTLWSILVSDDPEDQNLRAVGQVETKTTLTRDGWHRISSSAWFDTGEALKGTPLAANEPERIII